MTLSYEAEAIHHFLGEIRTEPMTRAEICAAFGYDRAKFSDLASVLPIEPFDGRFRLRLRDMPAGYVAKIGFRSLVDAGLCGNVRETAESRLIDGESMRQYPQ